jgi:hypothetical protein
MLEHVRRCSCVLLLLVSAVLPVGAHHSFAMFDMDKNVEFEGTVVAYQWGNPHVHIVIRVAPQAGLDPSHVGSWDLECAGSTTIMGRQGWTRNTLKAGDSIRVVVHPLRDGNKGASLFYMIKPDGTRLYTDIARPKAS